MSLKLDFMFALIQVLPYLVTTVALYFIILQPLYAYLTEREGVSAKARAKAEDLNASADERSAELQAKLAATRGRVSDIRDGARSRAKAREEELLQAARADAEAQVAAGVAQIEASAKQARTSLKSTSQDLAGTIASQVLGRSLDNQEA